MATSMRRKEVDEPSDSEAEDGLFEYDVQGTLASRDVQGVELPEVLAAVVEPEGVPRIPPESLREAGNDCASPSGLGLAARRSSGSKHAALSAR